jgi:hypothetical protein
VRINGHTGVIELRDIAAQNSLELRVHGIPTTELYNHMIRATKALN